MVKGSTDGQRNPRLPKPLDAGSVLVSVDWGDQMSGEIVDFGRHQDAKMREGTETRPQVDSMLEYILAKAIEQMWSFADRRDILKTLRFAIEVIEESEDIEVSAP